jgi:5-amino-6-(5-phosphoribosylamino)uracil reductase
MELQRLLPEPGLVHLEELLRTLSLADRAPADRPYTIANFVASVDGRATFQGRSGQLGDEGDRAMFHGLRAQVDAVLAGTTTLRIERYRRLIKEPDQRRRRAERGLLPEPLACVVTRSGDVPTDIPLFSEPEARVVVFTPAPLETGSCQAQVDIVRLDPGELTLTTVLRRLRSDDGIRTLLCEGGPTLFGGLLREGLVDELFLTLAPKLVGGGSGPTISSGPELSELAKLALIWALERNGSLYLRYRFR